MLGGRRPVARSMERPSNYIKESQGNTSILVIVIFVCHASRTRGSFSDVNAIALRIVRIQLDASSRFERPDNRN